MAAFTSWLIAGSIAAGIGTSVASGNQQRNFANDQTAHVNQVNALNKSFRLEVMNYQNKEWAKDIVHFDQLIDFQTGEFSKFKDYALQQSENVKEDYTVKIGTSLLRAVQEQVAASLQTATTDTQVRAETGTTRARVADMGVSGNSVAAVEGDIARQGGEARRAIDRNLEARLHQGRLEMLGIKAQKDSALASIQIPAFQPIQPPRPPEPVSPVAPAAPVSRPSNTAIALGAVSNGLNMGASMGNLVNAFRIP